MLTAAEVTTLGPPFTCHRGPVYEGRRVCCRRKLDRRSAARFSSSVGNTVHMEQEMQIPILPRTDSRVTAFSSKGCRRQWLVFGLAALLGITVVFSGQSEAARRSYRGRSSYSSRAAAAARANRTRMISSLQKQVSSAREVLKNLESQAVMTQTQLTSASSKLESIHQEIENSHQDAVLAAKTLRDLESEITLAQSPSSEFGKVSAAVDDAKRAVHLTIHEVLNLPLEETSPGIDAARADLQKFSDSQRDRLEADNRYKNADRAMRDAIRHLSQVRTEMYQADKDWAAAHQDLNDANDKKREEEKVRRQTGTAVTGKKHELQNMASVATNARSIISMGEYRLRQLGASTGSSSAKSSTTQKKSTQR